MYHNNSINGTLWKKSIFIITKHSYCLYIYFYKKLSYHYNYISSNFRSYSMDRATKLLTRTMS